VSDLVLGIGCTRGASLSLLGRGVAHVLSVHGLAPAAVRAIATIDRKRDEAGLTALAETNGWVITYFTKEELSEVEELLHASTRVQRATGVPAVAEPAARLLSKGPLIVPTTTYREPDDAARMTVAVARMEPRDG
jgi:cobalt-precorrin 5A hydrolase